MNSEEAVVVLADAVNQLGLAFERLASITPNTEANWAREARRDARATVLKVRVRMAELIPE